MKSDPGLIHYACIAQGTTILAEFNSKDAALGTTAAKCLEKKPPFHAYFNHTVRSRTYTFLIEEPLVYFLISDDKLGKSEGLAFLKSVRDAFVEDGKKLQSQRFQGIIRRLLGAMKNKLVEPVIGRRKMETKIDGLYLTKPQKQVGLDLISFAILFLVWLWFCCLLNNKCMEARLD